MKDTKEILPFFREIVKRVLEEMIKEERAIYLEGHPETKGNGYYERDLGTAFGMIEGLRVARTRDGKFSTSILPRKSRFSVEVGELVEALFISGLSTRKISRILEVLYGMKMSPQTASRLAEVGTEEVRKWKERPLESFYPVVFLDATFFAIRRGGKVEKEPVYVVLGINREGKREVLGFYEGGSGESATLWEEVLWDIKRRGVKEVLLYVGDGLTGLSEAVRKVYSGSRFQYCVLHAVKSSLMKVRVKDRAVVAEDLKRIYRSYNREEAEQRLSEFKKKWLGRYPRVVRWWEEHFKELTEFLDFPLQIRGMIYTTNQLERLFKEVKRRLKVMEVLPEEEKAEKILYLIFRELNDRYGKRKLRGFEEAIEEYLLSMSSMVREELIEQTQLS